MNSDSYIKIKCYRVKDACENALNTLKNEMDKDFENLILRHSYVKKWFTKSYYRTREEAIRYIKETNRDTFLCETCYDHFKRKWDYRMKPYQSLRWLADNSDESEMYLSHSDHELIKEYL